MTYDYRALANNYISNLTPYQPGKPIEELERELGVHSAIKLASNENPLGPSPKAIVAAKKALLNSHIYPDGGCFQLKQALSKSLNICPEQFTIGNGSENILEIIIKSYLSTQDNAVISEYAFLTIPLLIKSYGGEIIRVSAKNFAHDTVAMQNAINKNTRLLFIVNPNNPTGTYTTLGELKTLLNNIPPNIIVVLDEAYNEYINLPDYPQTLALLEEYPNLIITRTFSKIYGLAALRVGYAISSTAIADILNRARLPFNVNSIATAAATAALEDTDFIQQSIMVNTQGKHQLEEAFKKWLIEYIPSIGNFITINIKKNALEVYQALLHKGIIVRPLIPYQLENYLRVTIGTFEQNERFLAALQTVLEG